MRKKGILVPLEDPEESIIHNNKDASNKSKTNNSNKTKVAGKFMDEHDGKRNEITIQAISSS